MFEVRKPDVDVNTVKRPSCTLWLIAFGLLAVISSGRPGGASLGGLTDSVESDQKSLSAVSGGNGL